MVRIPPSGGNGVAKGGQRGELYSAYPGSRSMVGWQQPILEMNRDSDKMVLILLFDGGTNRDTLIFFFTSPRPSPKGEGVKSKRPGEGVLHYNDVSWH